MPGVGICRAFLWKLW